MKPSLSLKTLLRTPVKTLLTFILLAAASFALFSRFSEFVVTTREFNRIASGYRGVGAVEYGEPEVIGNDTDAHLLLDERTPAALKEKAADYEEVLASSYHKPLDFADIETISRLPYISSLSTRYLGSGVSVDGYARLSDIQDTIYNYAYRLVVEAVYSGTYGGFYGGGFGGGGNTEETMRYRTLRLTDIKVLAGVTDRVMYEMYVDAAFFPESDLNAEGPLLPYTNANKYQRSVFYPELSSGDFRALVPGERYIFSLRYIQGNPVSQSYPLLSADRWAQEQWPTIYPLSGQPENYLETEEFAALRDYITLCDNDPYTFDMVYTDDMSSILRFAEGKMDILDGRAITAEDVAAAAPVCVISKTMSRRYRLEPGDTLTMRLGDKLHRQNWSLGAISVIPERAPDTETTVTLEVVGVYTDLDTTRARLDDQIWVYSNNTIFLPLSLLNASEEARAAQLVSPTEFSFVIDDAKNITKFLEESAPVLEEMGLTLLFSDNGWPLLEAQFGAAGNLSLIAVLTLFAAAFVVILLTVYLFIGRKKRDYAIMRALGVPKTGANRALFLPLAVLAALAVTAGSAAAFISSNGAAANALGDMQEAGFTIDTSVPLTAVLGCVLGELAVICAVALFGLWRVSRRPPLALLQAGAETGHSKKEKKKKAPKPASAPKIKPEPVTPTFILYASGRTYEEIYEEEVYTESPVSLKPEELPRDYGGAKQTLRMVLLRIGRARVKTVMTVLLAAMMFGAIMQLAALRHSYQVLYETMEVKSTFMGGIPLDKALIFEDSGYVKKPYYEYVSSDDSMINADGLDAGGNAVTVCLTTDFARFTGGAVETVFLEGYDESSLLSDEAYCVLGEELMIASGLQLGEVVRVMNTATKRMILDNYSKDLQEPAMNKKSVNYTIIGYVSSGNDLYDNYLYIAANTLFSVVYGGRHVTQLRFAEFTLAQNDKASEYIDFATETVKQTTGRQSIFLDTTELDRVRNNMDLYANLFPIVAALLLIMGGMLPGLMILQSAKEASIFRILGTSKLRTRFILALGQLTLCLMGLGAGLAAIWLYNGHTVVTAIGATVALNALLYALSCGAAAAFCAAAVTRRKVLELLQTKE